MLPKPFDNYVPKFFTRDAKLTAYTDKMDSIMDDLSDDTLGLNNIIDPVQIPSNLLDEVGHFLSAGINAQDSEAIKRNKIANAVQGHKLRGTFAYDVKPKIDAIAGGDSQIIRSFDKDDWILVGDGLTPSAYYWAALGCDGVDTDLGISLIGEGMEIEVAGNIYIDVDNNALTVTEQEQIQLDMADIIPAYMYIHFGYLTGTVYTEYFMMG